MSLQLNLIANKILISILTGSFLLADLARYLIKLKFKLNMALYEVVFIARQDLSVEDVDNLSDKFSKIITDYKGKVVSKEYWGLRSLAYKIKKNSRGHYVALNCDANFEAIAEVKRVIGFSEDIIRSSIFKVDKHQSPSLLMVSQDAKSHKSGGDVIKQDSSELDSVIDQIVINHIL